MAGDHWRKRHDTIKQAIAHLCVWAGFQVETEVLYLLNAFIRNLDEFKEKPERTRQGLIPDIYVSNENYLADIKTISVCPSRYGPEKSRNNKRAEAVRVRQQGVHSAQ